MDLHLTTSGPHSDEYIREVANGLAEVVRVLTHATFPGDGGITHPATVGDVLGSLHAGAYGLDQLLLQLRGCLAAQRESGRLRERRADGQGDPNTAVMAVTAELLRARRASAALADALRGAQNATSGLYLNDSGGGE